jgi:predicted AlkP superfamily pyrophosphatase or phosphodiesterase
MLTTRSRIIVGVAIVATALIGAALVAAAPAPPPAPPSQQAIFFAADGMRPDMMERYVAEGAMPTYAELMRRGVRGANGLVQAFPPNTGVG